MDATQRHELANRIRNAILENKVSDAIFELHQWAAQVNKDYWDESITIGANWNKLQQDIRRNIYAESQLDKRRNALIDQMLDLNSNLESYAEGDHPITPQDSVGVEIPVILKDEKADKNATQNRTRTRDILLYMALLIAAFAIAIYFFTQEEEPDHSFCQDLYSQANTYYRDNKFVEAKNLFTTLMMFCPELNQQRVQSILKDIEENTAEEITEVDNPQDKTPDNTITDHQTPRSPSLNKPSTITADAIEIPSHVISKNKHQLLPTINKEIIYRKPVTALNWIINYRSSQGSQITKSDRQSLLKYEKMAIERIDEQVRTTVKSNDKDQIMKLITELDLGQLKKNTKYEHNLDTWITQLKKAYHTAN